MRRRTQLYLDEEQHRLLRKISQRTGKSMGQLVREAVDEIYLQSRPQEKILTEQDPIWDFVGAGSSDEEDVSSRHDEHLYGLDR